MADLLTDQELADMGERATADIEICALRDKVCSRTECYLPEVAQNARDMQRLLAHIEALRADRDAAREERDAAWECDCVPFAVSSRACHKCGRRGIVTKEVMADIVERSERVLRAEADRDTLLDALTAILESGIRPATYEPDEMRAWQEAFVALERVRSHTGKDPA